MPRRLWAVQRERNKAGLVVDSGALGAANVFMQQMYAMVAQMTGMSKTQALDEDAGPQHP